MTTKVKISIVQAHMPVVVETLRSDGSVQHTQTLSTIDGGGGGIRAQRSARCRNDVS